MDTYFVDSTEEKWYPIEGPKKNTCITLSENSPQIMAGSRCNECFTPFKVGDKVRKRKCDHFVHIKCMSKICIVCQN
jgi:hypothetical protein